MHTIFPGHHDDHTDTAETQIIGKSVGGPSVHQDDHIECSPTETQSTKGETGFYFAANRSPVPPPKETIQPTKEVPLSTRFAAKKPATPDKQAKKQKKEQAIKRAKETMAEDKMKVEALRARKCH